MATRQVREFNIADDFIATRPLKLDAQRLQVGEFLVKDGLSEDFIYRLYRGGRILAVPPGSAALASVEAGAAVPATPAVEDDEPTPAPDGAGDGSDPSGGPDSAADAPAAGEGQPGPAGAAVKVEGPYTLVHKGFGRWFVEGSGGATVSGPYAKADAEEALKALQHA